MKKGTWSQEDIDLLVRLCTEGTTKTKAANMLDRSKSSVVNKARVMNLGFLKRGEWSVGELARFRQLANEGKNKQQIAEAMGRSEAAVQCKATRLGIQLMNGDSVTGLQKRMWSVEDRELLKELWLDDSKSLGLIARKLKRGTKAIQSQACAMGLGPRSRGLSQLTPADISMELGVSVDCVYQWMDRGLVYSRHRVGPSSIMIKPEDLLTFLEKNRIDFDVSKMSPYLFAEEPEWLVRKRKLDMQNRPRNHRGSWTNDEDKLLRDYHNMGLSNEEISERMGRSIGSILNRKFILCLASEHTWSKEEIAVLKSCDNITELCKLLPKRSRHAIESKRRKLNLGGES